MFRVVLLPVAQRKTLLFVADTFPYPLDRGQHVRIQNLLAACSESFDVTFLGPSPESESHREHVEPHCARLLCTPPAPARLGARLALTARTLAYPLGVPRPSTIRRYQPYVAALREARPETFDLIWVERPNMGRLIPKALRGRTVLDLDDVEHRKQALAFHLEKAPLRRARIAYRYGVHVHLELFRAKDFLASVVCSDEDREYLASRGCRNAFVVPNAPAVLPPPPLPRRPRDRRSPLRLVFLGNVAGSANADAIEFFATEVLPVLEDRSPGVTLDVIGPNPQRFVPGGSLSSRVRFRGFVEDLASALSEYDVLVAPLRVGGGTKLKVLDAMALGIPVVTTPVGAEGLAIVHGQHAWIGRNAEELVDGVLRIEADALFAARLVESAYAHVRERFSSEQIRKSVSKWVGQLVPRRR